MTAETFPAPVDAPVPAWADDVRPWEFDDVDQLWRRELSRRVGDGVSAVQISAGQEVGADGVVHTSPVELLIPAGSSSAAVVYPEEIDDLVGALTATRSLLRGDSAPPATPVPDVPRGTVLTPFLTAYRGVLRPGMLGGTRHDLGVIVVDPRQRRRKYTATVLHEVFHFLLEHSRPQDDDVEQRVEALAVTVAADLLALGNFTREQLAVFPLDDSCTRMARA